MENVNLKDVQLNDLVRYQYCMNSRNNYSVVEKITKSYIILKNGMKFKIKDGWGVSHHSRYCIEGINDQEKNSKQDQADLYYW